MATSQCQHSSITAALDLPTLLPGLAQLGLIMHDFTYNFLSNGTHCDAEATPIFMQFWVTIHNRDCNIILQGLHEEHGSQLWCINLRACNNPV